MAKNTLNRSEILKKREDFISLFKVGKRIRIDAFTITYLVYPSTSSPKIYAGFTAPKRYQKKAVRRNRIKRLMREVYRCNKQGLYHIAQKNNVEIKLLLGYSHSVLPTFTECNDKISQLISRLETALTSQINENK